MFKKYARLWLVTLTVGLALPSLAWGGLISDSGTKPGLWGKAPHGVKGVARACGEVVGDVYTHWRKLWDPLAYFNDLSHSQGLAEFARFSPPLQLKIVSGLLDKFLERSGYSETKRERALLYLSQLPSRFKETKSLVSYLHLLDGKLRQFTEAPEESRFARKTHIFALFYALPRDTRDLLPEVRRSFEAASEAYLQEFTDASFEMLRLALWQRNETLLSESLDFLARQPSQSVRRRLFTHLEILSGSWWIRRQLDQKMRGLTREIFKNAFGDLTPAQRMRWEKAQALFRKMKAARPDLSNWAFNEYGTFLLDAQYVNLGLVWINEWDPQQSWLQYTYTAESHRRQGIFSTLLALHLISSPEIESFEFYIDETNKYVFELQTGRACGEDIGCWISGFEQTPVYRVLSHLGFSLTTKMDLSKRYPRFRVSASPLPQ